jgi:hypothetical protein
VLVFVVEVVFGGMKLPVVLVDVDDVVEFEVDDVAVLVEVVVVVLVVLVVVVTP